MGDKDNPSRFDLAAAARVAARKLHQLVWPWDREKVLQRMLVCIPIIVIGLLSKVATWDLRSVGPNPLPFELPPFTDETLRVLGRIAFEGGLGMLCHYLLLLLVLRSGGHANAQLRQQQTHPEPLRITDETEGPNGTRH